MSQWPRQPEPRRTVDYRHPQTRQTPAQEPQDQWLRDDQAFGGCMVYGLLAGTVILAILGAIAGVAWWLIGM